MRRGLPLELLPPRARWQWRSMLPNTGLTSIMSFRATAGMAGQAGDLHDADHSAGRYQGEK